jgi:hypothetical protein
MKYTSCHLGILLVALMGIHGCSKNENPSRRYGPIDAQALSDLEGQIYLDLPDTVYLLHSEDGGRMDPHDKFHRWLLYSKVEFSLSPTNGAQSEYLSEHHGPDDTAEYISSMMRGPLAPAKDASSAIWVVGSRTYTAGLLRTTDGYYLVVDRAGAQRW